MAINRAEIEFPWGGKLVITAQGDFSILQDTANEAPATQQRLSYIIQQCAIDIVQNADGNAVVLLPDDVFNPNQGSSARRLLGALPNAKTLALVKSRIAGAIVLDPGIAASPAPVVTVTNPVRGLIVITGFVYDITGQYIPIPSTAITITNQ